MAFLCGIALLAQGGAARARELSEILIEKGVITPEEQAEAAKTKTGVSVSYKEGSGMTFTTADDRFRLSTGVWGQLRYTLTDVDQSYTNPSRGSEDSQTFDFPRIRAYWKGNAYSPRLTYEVELELNASSGDLLRNAYADYGFFEDGWLNLRFGQWKTPYCRQEMTPDSRQEFNERSIACQNFRFERDKGVQLYGLPMSALVEYYAGVFNGTGRNGPPNPDTNFLYVFRLATNPLGPVGYSEGDVQDSPHPLFGIGTSFGYERARADEFTTAATATVDPDDPDEMEIASLGQPKNRVPFLLMIQPFYDELANPGGLTAEVQNFEVDGAFRWRGFFAQAEYYHAWVSNDANGSAAPAPPFVLPQKHFQAWGYYAQAGYFIIPKKLEVAARYSELVPNKDFQTTKANGRTITPSQTELLGAVNYYFSGHNLKLMTDFGPITNEAVRSASGAIQDKDDFRWRLQAQMYF
jgi:phosphate-selective porin OprO/OprP